MLNGIETIFDNTTQMLRQFKEKINLKKYTGILSIPTDIIPGNDRICGQYFR